MESSPINRRELLTGVGGAATLASLGIPSFAAQDPVRCGFVGVGSRGTDLLNAVLKVPSVDVVAICDIDPANRGKACDRVAAAGGRKRPDEIGDWRKLLDRKDITAVVAAL